MRRSVSGQYIYQVTAFNLPVLAQVGALLPMLKRGVGVHHSGLLPILKEVIEIMFQENLIKVLLPVNLHPFSPQNAWKYLDTCLLLSSCRL